MKKVININFQGRVIPIEESAYDMLKQYVESLRKFFANEEGATRSSMISKDVLQNCLATALKKEAPASQMKM